MLISALITPLPKSKMHAIGTGTDPLTFMLKAASNSQRDIYKISLVCLNGNIAVTDISPWRLK